MESMSVLLHGVQELTRVSFFHRLSSGITREAPVSVPSTFLAGRWRGDAVLISGRKDHPTAPPERAQDLCNWDKTHRKVEGANIRVR